MKATDWSVFITSLVEATSHLGNSEARETIDIESEETKVSGDVHFIPPKMAVKKSMSFLWSSLSVFLQILMAA